jgi:hypothetical protein
VELPAGLWTWTGMHPGFGAEVRSYAYETPDALVLIDPIAPLPEGLPDKQRGAALTSAWHERSARALELPIMAPPEIEAYPGTYEEEWVLWIPEHRALVFGDALGALADPRWLPEGQSADDVRAKLRPLLDLPVELVLLTHGEPTDRAGLEALLGG